MRLKECLQIGIVNTLRINIHYLGIKSIFSLPIICTRRVKFRKLEGSVRVQKPVFAGVRIGFDVVGTKDPRYNRTLIENTGSIIFTGTARIGAGSAISCDGQLIVGDNFIITAASTISASESVVIGDNVLMSWDCLVLDNDFHKIVDLKSGNSFPHSMPIVIGDHVWIGCRSLILKGVNIPKNSVIAASSTVTKSLDEENSVFVSNRSVRTGINWKV